MFTQADSAVSSRLLQECFTNRGGTRPTCRTSCAIGQVSAPGIVSAKIRLGSGSDRHRQRRLANRGFDLINRNVPHAQVMAEVADRFVTRPTGSLLAVSITAAIGLSGAQCQGLVGPKIPTAAVPSAAATWRRPESLETRYWRPRAQGWHCAGPAPSGRGCRPGQTVRFAPQSPFPPAPRSPTPGFPRPRGVAPFGVIGCGPALGWPDRARRERHHRTAVECEPQPLAPRPEFARGHLEFRQRPLAGGFRPLG